MDANEMDIDYELDDAEPVQPVQDAPTLTVDHATNDGDQEMPAAYFESLESVSPVPEFVNLQGEGIKDWGPDDPQAYANEHCPIVRAARVRWVDNVSFNFEYSTADDAALALRAFSQDEDQADGIPAQTQRPAKAYSKLPHVDLVVREGNTGDRKKKDASKQGDYYKKNSQTRPRGRERRPEREEPTPIFLDYGEDNDGGSGDRRRRHVKLFDDPMPDGSSSDEYALRRNHRYTDRGRARDSRASREPRDVDRYVPASDREPRFGRLRGRSASPAASEDGRLGFADNGANLRQRYRSRSREATRRRRPSFERSYNKRRSPAIELENNRWKKDPSVAAGTEPFAYHKERMGHHRRSDAKDESANTGGKGSIFDRMTKDGKPLSGSKPSIMSRISRDDKPRESNYGRLKDDWSEPQESFAEVAPKRSSLFSRITRDDDDLNIRGASSQDNGISIRGSAGGFSIRGAAGGE
ncbi:hypothetical protein BDV96DRAFT_644051 [Lophiotrema nucula]|uniref:Uncharacterized protein n=1 Tax=Lophiotrema nucula TaxID=690887 RepID=A0A6A5ZFI6_9PLEO|nr:hypothetical protein BDV96DRAFT_644051 [Lophiotrema nucula]